MYLIRALWQGENSLEQICTTSHVLRSLQELVDASHILFGSDYPFAPEIVTSFSVRGIQDHDGFDEQARRAVERESALALFPRLSSYNENHVF